MDKRIGNFYFLLLLINTVFFTSSAQQELRLRVLDKNQNKPVTTLAVGVPYTLEIQAEGNQDLYNSTIAGIENFHSEFCGASHVNMMSHVTTVHNYVLRADKVGVFTLGPVQIATSNGKTISSNILKLHVDQHHQTDVTVEMILDKTSFFVGQKIYGKIRFCTCIELQLLNFQLPAIEPTIGQCSQVGQHQQSKITLDGKSYDCYEFPLELSLKQPGRFSLPKIGAFCRVPLKRQHSMWGMNFPIHGSQDQWFYSEEQVFIQVDQLPPCSDPVDGVGQFDTVTLTIDHTKASLGEGIVATLHIEGKDGVHDLKQPLLNMPEGLKYYESKSFVEPLQHDRYKKSFEYIVQGTRAGTWKIPIQTLQVFDTGTQAYKKLKTKPLSVTITGNTMYQSNNHADNHDQQSTNFIDQDIHSINQDGPWIPIEPRSLSLVWFAFLIALSLIGTIIIGIKKQAKNRGVDYWMRKRKRYAFKQTRRKLLSIKKNNNVTQLYDVFINLFADRCQMSLSEITGERIEQYLKNAGFVAETIDQWNRFFQQLAEYAFVRSKIDQSISYDVFNRAQIWVNQLEEKL